uniref:DUF4439 domain-containing protein n=3 Tax=Pseudonocardiaceae TaxID=2070 RepID=A0A2W4JEC4_9PSEU|nr:MAG: DUF4439 domain-containing protein [Thermocrispum agreste]
MLGVQVGRRDVLRWSGTALLTMPFALSAVSACSGGYDDSPDPLAPVAAAARADAEAAREMGGKLAEQIAELRAAQADAVQREVDRANRPPAPAGDRPPATSPKALGKRLRSAAEQAVGLIPRESRPRAGLLASVAAGCSAGLALDGSLGSPPAPRFAAPDPGDQLDEAAVQTLQDALAAEHATLWVFGLVTAFLPGSYDKGLRAATVEHRQRRDAAQAALISAGATPVLAETAYATPKPVKDDKSARAAVVAAETDAVAAWRVVIEHCDVAQVRSLAVAAMQASAARLTRWRLEAGMRPAALAMPGARS